MKNIEEVRNKINSKIQILNSDRYFDYRLLLNSYSLLLSMYGGFLFAMCCIVFRSWYFIFPLLPLYSFKDLNLTTLFFGIYISFSSLKNLRIPTYLFLFRINEDVFNVYVYSQTMSWDSVFLDLLIFSNKHDIYLFSKWGNDISFIPPFKTLGVSEDLFNSKRSFWENDFIVSWSFFRLWSLYGTSERNRIYYASILFMNFLIVENTYLITLAFLG